MTAPTDADREAARAWCEEQDKACLVGFDDPDCGCWFEVPTRELLPVLTQLLADTRAQGAAEERGRVVKMLRMSAAAYRTSVAIDLPEDERLSRAERLAYFADCIERGDHAGKGES